MATKWYAVGSTEAEGESALSLKAINYFHFSPGCTFWKQRFKTSRGT